MGAAIENIFAIVALRNEWHDEHRLDDQAAAYRAFRLKSLQLSPDAFGSTFEKESQFSDDVWKGRLRNPKATIFVALPLDLPSLWKCYGTAVVLEVDSRTQRAASINPYASATNKQGDVLANLKVVTDLLQTSPRGIYQINAMFVDPAMRGLGIGAGLLQNALHYIAGETHRRGLLSSRVDIFVFKHNFQAKGLYLKCGFQVVGEQVLGDDRVVLLLSQTVETDAAAQDSSPAFLDLSESNRQQTRIERRVP
jgi:ribosomal protein S18 acetylase RimI-like enzyme